jgi:hypothetical protein
MVHQRSQLEWAQQQQVTLTTASYYCENGNQSAHPSQQAEHDPVSQPGIIRAVRTSPKWWHRHRSGTLRMNCHACHARSHDKASCNRCSSRQAANLLQPAHTTGPHCRPCCQDAAYVMMSSIILLHLSFWVKLGRFCCQQHRGSCLVSQTHCC